MMKNYPRLLINLMTSFELQVGEALHYHGFKFNYQHEYPGNTRKGYKNYIKELWNEQNLESYQKILHWEKLRHDERTHIYLSKAFLSGRAGLLILIVSIVQLGLQYNIISIVFTGIAAFLFLASIIFRKKANNTQRSIGLLEVLIDHFVAK